MQEIAPHRSCYFLRAVVFLFQIILHWRIVLARRPRGFGSSLGGGGSGGDFEDFLGWLSASYRINDGGGDFPSPPFTSLCDWRRTHGRSGEYSSEWSRRPTQAFVAVYEVSMQLRIWWRSNGLKFGSRRWEPHFSDLLSYSSALSTLPTAYALFIRPS